MAHAEATTLVIRVMIRHERIIQITTNQKKHAIRTWSADSPLMNGEEV